MKTLVTMLLSAAMLFGCAAGQAPGPQPPTVAEEEKPEEDRHQTSMFCAYGVAYLASEYLDENGQTEAMAITVMMLPDGRPVPCVEQNTGEAGEKEGK